jgi:enoyl-CoA hydratase
MSVTAPPGQVALTVEGHVATLTLDRAAKLNALTPEMLNGFGAALAEIAGSDARVVLIRAAGAKAFCVGADINRFAGLAPAEMWREWTVRGHHVFDALAHLRPPTVAVIHGHAFGGGLELALACDFRVMADTARLGLPEAGLGTVPGWGGTERLTELVGRARAKEVILARRQIDGPTALDWGAVNHVASGDDLDAVVEELVGSLLQGAPMAVQLGKQLIDAAADGAPASVLEPLAAGLIAGSADLAEGVAAFRERRSPTFGDA